MRLSTYLRNRRNRSHWANNWANGQSCFGSMQDPSRLASLEPSVLSTLCRSFWLSRQARSLRISMQASPRKNSSSVLLLYYNLLHSSSYRRHPILFLKTKTLPPRTSAKSCPMYPSSAKEERAYKIPAQSLGRTRRQMSLSQHLQARATMQQCNNS